MSRLSVLAVTSEVPWPLDSGGHLRTFHLLRSLAAHHDVRLIAPTTTARLGRDSAALVRARMRPCLVEVSPRGPVSEAVKLARAAVGGQAYLLYRRHWRPRVARTIVQEMARRPPDLLYLDHLDSMLYAQHGTGVPHVVDMHNVYSLLAARAACEAGDPMRRWYLSREAALLQRAEHDAARRAATLFAVSEQEADHFRRIGAARVAVVPNGVDCDGFGELQTPSATATILFVGTLEWQPNIAAVQFLASEVLPRVRARVPEARLAIVGRNPTAAVKELAAVSGIELAANVPDVRPYYKAAQVMAVPLAVGGGTRLKILEAFAAGVPVVSTPIGCEGIGAEHGVHLLTTDHANMADAVLQVLTNPAHARGLAERARQFVRERFDWSVVGREAARALDETAASTARTPRRTYLPPAELRVGRH